MERGYTVFSQTPRHWQPWNQGPCESSLSLCPTARHPGLSLLPPHSHYTSFPPPASWSSPAGSGRINNSPQVAPREVQVTLRNEKLKCKGREQQSIEMIKPRDTFSTWIQRTFQNHLWTQREFWRAEKACAGRKPPGFLVPGHLCAVWLPDHGLVSPWGQILLTDSQSTLWAYRNEDLGPDKHLKVWLCHPEGTGLLVHGQILPVSLPCASDQASLGPLISPLPESSYLKWTD